MATNKRRERLQESTILERLVRIDERLELHLDEEEKRNARLDGHFARMGDNLERIGETLIKQQMNLEDHVKRAAETEAKLAQEIKARQTEIQPLLDKQQRMKGFFEYGKPFLKILAFMLAIGSGGLGVEKLLSILVKL